MFDNLTKRQLPKQLTSVEYQPTEALGGSTFDASHLIGAGIVSQDLAFVDTMGARVFGSSNLFLKPFVALTQAMGNVKYIDSNKYFYRLGRTASLEATVTQVVCNESYPGINMQKFEIVLDKPYLHNPDVIVPEDSNYMLLIHSTESKTLGVGNGYQYTVQLVTNNANEYLPPDLLQVGRTFVKSTTYVTDEMNVHYGTFQFGTMVEHYGNLSYHAEKWEFSDKALRKLKQYYDKTASSGLEKDFQGLQRFLSIPLTYKDPSTGQDVQINNFVYEMEALLMERLYNDVEYALVRGRKSDGVIQSAGDRYVTATGSGWFEQMRSGNNYFYQPSVGLNIEELYSYLNTLLVGKTDFGQRATFYIICGNEFKVQFNRAVKEVMGNVQTVINLPPGGLTSANTSMTGGDLTFDTYQGQFFNVTLIHAPQYDNPAWERKMHPDRPNVPQTSWRGDILDLSELKGVDGTNLGNNICMVKETHTDYKFTSKGKWDLLKWMPTTDGSYGTAGDYMSMNVETSEGLLIIDATRCVSIIPII